MTKKISKQMIAGKSFEYSLLVQFEEKLKDKTNVQVIKNSAFYIAKDCFYQVTEIEQSEYLISASFTVNFLMDIEPRLSNDVGKNDILELQILSDNHGKSGDVRDVLAIRLLQKWEIGVSAKNNHKAVKHSRLSANIDFGEKWLNTKVSKEYFDTVTPIFENLKKIRQESNATAKWSELENHHESVYIPILKAFSKELKKLYKKDSLNISKNIVAYLVGNQDFYKVIKRKNTVEIYAYNINGDLNLPFKNIKPKHKTPQVLLPSEITDISFKKGSKTTVIVTLNNDWTLSFRIHNASSRVESSLKFDINLLKSPKSLYKNTLNIIHNNKKS